MWDRWMCMVVCVWVAMATVKTVHGRCGPNHGRHYMVEDRANNTRYTLHIWGMTLPQVCPWQKVFDETVCECLVDLAAEALRVLKDRQAGKGGEKIGKPRQFNDLSGYPLYRP